MSNIAIHPELRFVARWLPRGLIGRLPLSLSRGLGRLLSPPCPPGVTVVERALDGVAPGALPRVRVISPLERGSGPRPAMLWIHGGGYILGEARHEDGLCAAFARRLGVNVVSVDYRLAPEHPYPTPLDDCFAALEWMLREASALGIDTARYIIGGVSAGGGLAAALTLRAHDRKLPPPRLQLLVYPMLDDRTVDRRIDGSAHRLWDQASNRRGWASYLGRGRLGRGDTPDYAAPARRVDLSGLPPAWIGVGTADLFHDEDVEYARRLRAAGVPTDLEVVEGAFHAFDGVAPKAAVSRRFHDAQIAAIEKALDRCGSREDRRDRP